MDSIQEFSRKRHPLDIYLYAQYTYKQWMREKYHLHGKRPTSHRTQKCSKTAVENNRPISLMPVNGRLMETIVRDYIVSHMMENILFCYEQHGFVPGVSCMTQLLITIELWTELLDTGATSNVIYLDIKKVFYSVPHKRLLYKLDAYSIGDPIKEGIKIFLVNRKQRVTVNGIMLLW